MTKEVLDVLRDIQASLDSLKKDVALIKKAVLAEAKLEKEEMELEEEMRDLERSKPSQPTIPNEVRYNEETLDEVEKELGK